MKGILFGGCSFTWGQGLYFYSTLPNLKYTKDYGDFNRLNVTQSHIEYKNTLYYPRLVSRYFNTFEIFKEENGGSEDENFKFFNGLFETGKFVYEDFSYIIIQISNLWRNRFYYDDNNPTKFIDVGIHDNIWISKWYPEFLDWLCENDVSIEECVVKMKEQQILRLEKEIKFYENKGIKCKLILWPNDLLPLILSNEYLSNRLITINFNKNEYFTISELHIENKNLIIHYDFDYFGKNTPIDHHPSKLCHEIIAENIINNIKKDLK